MSDWKLSRKAIEAVVEEAHSNMWLGDSAELVRQGANRGQKHLAEKVLEECNNVADATQFAPHRVAMRGLALVMREKFKQEGIL